MFSEARYTVNNRILSVGDFRFATIAGPALSPFTFEHALTVFREHAVETTPDDFRKNAHVFGRLFERIDSIPPPNLVLTNSDGDEVVDITATFRLDDPDDAARRLAEHPNMESEDPGEFVWLREGGPGIWNNTVLGNIDIEAEFAVLDVNSHSRLERARALLESFPGVYFESTDERPFDLDSRSGGDRAPSKPTEPMSAEALDQMRAAIAEAQIAQLDQPVPMFGGRTPREHAKSHKGRLEVMTWIRTMPPIGVPGGSLPPPREELMRELGLSE